MIVPPCNEQSCMADDLDKAQGLHNATPWGRFASSYSCMREQKTECPN